VRRYAVLLRPAAGRDRRHLPPDIRRRISELLLALETDPRPMGTVKLAGQQNRWRMRVGDYRIIYEIADAADQVLVLRIAHRREAYR
jgi:mRNA interferase RelE/StbE